MKVYLQGSKVAINLDKKDFIASGGEGEIYGKGDMAYKIYTDPNHMIPIGKIQELSVLDNKNIIKPESIIYDTSNPIGYTMRLLKDTHVLVSLFTKAFKQRYNLSNDNILHLIHHLQDLISFIHSKDVLVVDLNEMNFLLDKHFKEVYAIDVNSYQTKHYPATAIMESIRDRHNSKFSDNTDWFSFAVIAFQMLIGIHPYKGSHPDFDNVPKDERLNARMLKNVSAFNQKTAIPKICQDLSIIPSGLKNWLYSVLEKGDRGIPPKDYDKAVQLQAVIKQVFGNNLFDIQEAYSCSEEILRIYKKVIFGRSHVYFGKKKLSYPMGAKVGIYPISGNPVIFWIDDGLKAMDIDGNELKVPAYGESLIECDGRVYVQNGTNIIELRLSDIGILPKVVGKVMDVLGATKVFDGCIIQNMLGSYYLTIFPISGRSYQIKLSELTGYKIIDAKYENKMLVVVAKNKNYDRFIFKISDDYVKYDLRINTDIVSNDINFTVNENGVCVLMLEEGLIEASKGMAIKQIHDKILESDMKFYHENDRMMFTKGSKAYYMRLK